MATQLSQAQKDRKDALVRIVKNGLNTFLEVGNALACLKDQRLYLDTHATFDEFVFETFTFRRGRAEQLIDMARTVEAISDKETAQTATIGSKSRSPVIGNIVPENERQTRALRGLSDALKIRVWYRAIEFAGGEQPSAAQIKQARDDFGDAYEGRAQPRRERLPQPVEFDTKEYESCLGKVIRQVEVLAKTRLGDQTGIAEAQRALRCVAIALRRFCRGSRTLYTGTDGVNKWRLILERSRSPTGARTFRQAEATFFRENEAWPNPDWPGMPKYEDDQFRFVADVPPERLK